MEWIRGTVDDTEFVTDLTFRIENACAAMNAVDAAVMLADIGEWIHRRHAEEFAIVRELVYTGQVNFA